MNFGNDNALGYYDHAGTVNGGLRLGWGASCSPTRLPTWGLASWEIRGSVPPRTLAEGSIFQITRVFSLGAQVAYNAVTITDRGDAAKWVSFGLNFGFHLGGTGKPRRAR